MRASELLVRCLENEGAQYVFGIPGEEVLDIMDSLSRSQIKFVLTRHEQGAALMASVYGRLTGRAGVCLSTIGPGATNLMTGVATAQLDRSPLVAISGQAVLERMYKDTHQWIDMPEIFRAVTKWNVRVQTAETIPELIRKAFDIAQRERPGATHLEIPMDISAKEVSGAPVAAKPAHYGTPDKESIQRAARVINEAENPVIIAGSGVIRRSASGELVRLAENLQIPVTQTFMGIGSINAENPLTLPAMNLAARDWEMCGLGKSDVVIAVGYDHIDCPPKFWNSGKNRKVIHIDTLPAAVDEYYHPELEITAEIGETLKALNEECKRRKSPPDFGTFSGLILRELEKYRSDESFPMKPQKLTLDLRSALQKDDILVSDVGAHKLWLARMYPANKPNSLIISNGFAPVGYGIPAAIAAKLVYPEKNVVAVCGDGGFLLNAQELETAKRLNTPFVTVIWVDEGYGLIEWKHRTKFGSVFGVRFTNPDIVKYANSLGLPGYTVKNAAEFLPILRQAMKEPLPSLVAVPVDYRENDKLAQDIGSNT